MRENWGEFEENDICEAVDNPWPGKQIHKEGVADRPGSRTSWALKSQWYGVINPIPLFPCFSHNFVFSSSHFLCVLENPPPTLLLREILLPPLESVLIPIFLDFPIISCFYQAIFFLGYLKTLLLHLGEIQLPRGVCDAPTVNLSAPNAATSSTFMLHATRTIRIVVYSH